MSIDLLAPGTTLQRRDQLGFRSKLPFCLVVGDGRVALTDDGAAADLTTVTDRTDRAGTFTRAGASGLYVSSYGRLMQTFTNFPAIESWDHDADGVAEVAGLRLDVARTSLITSQDISAWTNQGTPVVTAVTSPYAGVSGYLVEDNDGAANEGKYLAVVFTADAVKSVAICIKAGSATSSAVQLRDESAGADRILATVTWSGTDPGTPAMTTGTYLGKKELSDDWWLLSFQSTSVTAANTHRLYVYGASTTASSTGTTYWALPTAANAPYLTTVLTASQVGVADDLRFTFPFLVQPLSLYLKATELGTRYTATTAMLAAICLGTSSTTDPRLSIFTTGSGGYGVSWDPGTDTTATLAAFPAVSQAFELLVTLSSTGVATIYQSLAEAATTSAVASAQALPIAATYFGASQANARLVIGDIGAAGSNPSALSLHACKVDWGVKTMAQMRAAT